MPCDCRSEDDKYAEYMDVLREMQQLIHSYNPAHIIYGVTRTLTWLGVHLMHML